MEFGGLVQIQNRNELAGACKNNHRNALSFVSAHVMVYIDSTSITGVLIALSAAAYSSGN